MKRRTKKFNLKNFIDSIRTRVDSQFLKEDSAGDINLIDPMTGGKQVYISNGDGTYSNSLTGATYTRDDLTASIGSHREKSELIKKDYEVAEKVISEPLGDGND